MLPITATPAVRLSFVATPAIESSCQQAHLHCELPESLVGGGRIFDLGDGLFEGARLPRLSAGDPRRALLSVDGDGVPLENLHRRVADDDGGDGSGSGVGHEKRGGPADHAVDERRTA